MLARSQGDRSERFRLVGLTVTQKRPHFGVRDGLQPRMRIRGKAAAGFQFAPKILQLLRANAAFEERPGIHSGRGVSLKIDRVTFELLSARPKKMVEAHFVE